MVMLRSEYGKKSQYIKIDISFLARVKKFKYLGKILANENAI
jgi:hypothetical protein